MKTCLECQESKSLSCFYKDKRRKDKHGIYCKQCWALKYASTDEHLLARRLAVKRHWDKKSGTLEFKQQRRINQLKYLYCLSIEQYNSMLEKQDYKCGICLSLFDEKNKPRVDHDHHCCKGNRSCGECVRELLCRSCNHLIGECSENIDTLNNAILYLRRYPKSINLKD